MKENIHPQYFETKVTCACGNTFTTGSTKPEIHVEVCSNCHPFYTGQAKFVDTEGRVERFQRQAKEAEAKIQIQTQKKKEKEPRKQEDQPKSLKEMMEFLQKQS